MEHLLVIISAVFVNNIVLAQFLGICPFLGVSKKIPTALGMGAAVIFTMALATLATSLMEKLVLIPLGITYMRIVVFILVIAALVQFVEIVLKKVAPPLYQALGIYLPLITTNCAVLGMAIVVTQKNYSIVQSVVHAAASGLGFSVALVLFAGLREQLELVGVPRGMRGTPIALVTASILSMAFMGFMGLV